MPIIDVTQKVTSRLPIEPVKNADGNWKDGGLCKVVLHDVSLREQTDEKGEFAGITRKVLDITFINFKEPGSIEPDRFTTLSEKAIGTKMTKDGVLILRPEVDILTNNNDMYKRIKHILDQCVSSPTYRDLGAIDKATQEKYFDLPGIINGGTAEETAQIRAKMYDTFLVFIHDWFNGVTDAKGKVLSKCIYKDVNDTPIIHGWLKVLPAHPNYTYYAINAWVSQGFFEYASIDPQTKSLRKPLIIKVKPTESLELRKKGAVSDPGSGMPNVPNVSASMMAFLQSNQQE